MQTTKFQIEDEEGKEEVLTFNQSSTSMVFKDRTKVDNANVQIYYQSSQQTSSSNAKTEVNDEEMVMVALMFWSI